MLKYVHLSFIFLTKKDASAQFYYQEVWHLPLEYAPFCSQLRATEFYSKTPSASHARWRVSWRLWTSSPACGFRCCLMVSLLRTTQRVLGLRAGPFLAILHKGSNLGHPSNFVHAQCGAAVSQSMTCCPRGGGLRRSSESPPTS